MTGRDERAAERQLSVNAGEKINNMADFDRVPGQAELSCFTVGVLRRDSRETPRFTAGLPLGMVNGEMMALKSAYR